MSGENAKLPKTRGNPMTNRSLFCLYMYVCVCVCGKTQSSSKNKKHTHTQPNKPVSIIVAYLRASFHFIYFW